MKIFILSTKKVFPFALLTLQPMIFLMIKNLIISQFLLVIWGCFLRTFIWSFDQALHHMDPNEV